MTRRQRASARITPRLRARRGLSLVELIVAMTILSVGLMGLITATGYVARSLGDSRRETLAAAMAQSRVEEIAGTKCTSLTLDTWTTVTYRTLTEKYRVTEGENNTLVIVDTVSWPTVRGTRKIGVMTLLPCRPGA